MASTSAVSDSPTKPRVLEQRRCLLLAVTGSTADTIPRSPTLKRILEAGFLVQVKSWLDDILIGTVGEHVTTISALLLLGKRCF
jgi:hypothetical protein